MLSNFDIAAGTIVAIGLLMFLYEFAKVIKDKDDFDQYGL